MSCSTDYVALLVRMYGDAWAEPLARAIAREPSTVYGWKARGQVPKAVQAWLQRQEDERARSTPGNRVAKGRRAGGMEADGGHKAGPPHSCPINPLTRRNTQQKKGEKAGSCQHVWFLDTNYMESCFHCGQVKVGGA